MSYCQDCGEEFERGTILCPGCGSKLAEQGNDAATSSGWSSDDAADDRSTGWSVDESATDTATTASGRSVDESAGATATTDSGWGSDPADSDRNAGTPSEPKYHESGLLDVAISYPFGQRGEPLLISSVLVFCSFLLVPMVFVYGYAYRVGRAAARGDDELPPFDDWGELGRDGLILFGLYLGLSVAVGAVMLGLFGAITAVEDPLLVVSLFGIGSLLVLAGSYLAGAIVPVLLGTGSLGETFSDGRVLEFALSVHYLKGVLFLAAFSIGLSIVANVVVTVLVFTLVGIIFVIPLVPLLTAYSMLLSFAAWGYIYNEAAEAGEVTPVEPDAPLTIE